MLEKYQIYTGIFIEFKHSSTNMYYMYKIVDLHVLTETITATGGTKYSISSNMNAPSLTIYNVQESDEGVYTCFATNVVGTGLLRGYLSYKVTFFLSQRQPLNTGLTIFVSYCMKVLSHFF
jgi:hypothetical protein